MDSETERPPRFGNIGRVESARMCSLPGVLDNVSLTGFCAHFPVIIDPDMEVEYEISIKPASPLSGGSETFLLIGRPCWRKDIEGGTMLGFSLLRSPDTPRYAAYVESLSQRNKDSDSINSLLEEFSRQQ